MRRFSRQIVWLVLCAGSLALGGCSLFKEGGLFGRALIQTKRGQFAGHRGSDLPAIPSSRDAMQLEVLLVERAVGDPLLGDALWNEVDQIGSLDPETRLALARNGFRIGHTGSEPPRALAEMLDLKSEFAEGHQSEEDKKLVGRRIVLASGGETEVQAGALFDECTVDIGTAEASEAKEFQNARFVFRLKTERDQDGWARIEFLPEIHHGAYRLRRVSSNGGWQLKTAQDVYPLYNQRFSLMLNVGEMAIITADGEKPSSVGRHFFMGAGEHAWEQRLLVVRLSDMAKTDPVYAPQ